MDNRILTAVFHMLSTGQPYKDLGVNHLNQPSKTASAQTNAFSIGTAWLQGYSRSTNLNSTPLKQKLLFVVLW